jgi:hypothetical protein
MAVEQQEGTTGNEGGMVTARVELQTLPDQMCKHTIADWKDSAALYGRQKLFDKNQFVMDKELMFGGTIQKLVCTDINISGGERARQFWDDKGGKEMVRNTF